MGPEVLSKLDRRLVVLVTFRTLVVAGNTVEVLQIYNMRLEQINLYIEHVLLLD